MRAKLILILGKIFRASLLLLPLTASAFYNPTEGRWLSRDPVYEAGFTHLRESQSVAQWDAGKKSANYPHTYGFLSNDGLNEVDVLGLLNFEGCSYNQVQAYLNGFEAGCKAIKTAECKGCIGHFNIPQRLVWMCGNSASITVKCEPAGAGNCEDACAWSLPGGSTIHICGDAQDEPGCIAPDCLLLHEMTHIIGHGMEKWPVKVQNCLGCSRPF